MISINEAYGWDWTYHAYREWQGWSVEYDESIYLIILSMIYSYMSSFPLLPAPFFYFALLVDSQHISTA